MEEINLKLNSPGSPGLLHQLMGSQSTGPGTSYSEIKYAQMPVTDLRGVITSAKIQIIPRFKVVSLSCQDHIAFLYLFCSQSTHDPHTFLVILWGLFKVQLLSKPILSSGSNMFRKHPSHCNLTKSESWR